MVMRSMMIESTAMIRISDCGVDEQEALTEDYQRLPSKRKLTAPEDDDLDQLYPRLAVRSKEGNQKEPTLYTK